MFKRQVSGGSGGCWYVRFETFDVECLRDALGPVCVYFVVDGSCFVDDGEGAEPAGEQLVGPVRDDFGEVAPDFVTDLELRGFFVGVRRCRGMYQHQATGVFPRR